MRWGEDKEVVAEVGGVVMGVYKANKEQERRGSRQRQVCIKDRTGMVVRVM